MGVWEKLCRSSHLALSLDSWLSLHLQVVGFQSYSRVKELYFAGNSNFSCSSKIVISHASVCKPSLTFQTSKSVDQTIFSCQGRTNLESLFYLPKPAMAMLDSKPSCVCWKATDSQQYCRFQFFLLSAQQAAHDCFPSSTQSVHQEILITYQLFLTNFTHVTLVYINIIFSLVFCLQQLFILLSVY